MVDVQMNFNTMGDAKNAFKAAHQQLNESMDEMKKISKMMQDGALVGDGGTAFVDAINGPLLKRMTALSEKMAELEQDIDGAVVATRDGIKTAKSRFK